MAPLGMYGAIGGKDSNANADCDKSIVNHKGISGCQLKEMSLGTETNGIKHHLPFSSRSNGVSGTSTFTTEPQHDLVSLNAAITSMAVSHMNAGMNFERKLYNHILLLNIGSGYSIL